MKQFLLFLCLFPLAALSQTVHIADGRVVYRERVTEKGLSKDELYRRAQAAVKELVGGTTAEDMPDGRLVTDAKMKLSSSHSLRNRLRYQLTIDVSEGSYEYRIDSVAWITDARGKELVTTSSKKLVSNMEITGPTAARTEKQLNEIDMRLQKLIALLKEAMRRKE